MLRLFQWKINTPIVKPLIILKTMIKHAESSTGGSGGIIRSIQPSRTGGVTPFRKADSPAVQRANLDMVKNITLSTMTSKQVPRERVNDAIRSGKGSALHNEIVNTIKSNIETQKTLLDIAYSGDGKSQYSVADRVKFEQPLKTNQKYLRELSK